MNLIGLLVVVLVFGLIAWLIMRLPIEEPFRSIAIVVLLVVLVIWLLSALGGAGVLDVRVG